MALRRSELAAQIDHTALGPDVSHERVKELCREADTHGFHAVCVNPFQVALARSILEDSRVAIATVIGFPLGTQTANSKVFEAEQAIGEGADELDMVLNIAALKAGDYRYAAEEIQAVRQSTTKSPRPILLKVILETALLEDEQKVAGCILAKAAGADFVKTSTGFGAGGATVEDVALMRETVGSAIGVKAAGGIKAYEDAIRMVEAGATRLGTSSGVAILQRVPS